jgi:hypothetical protein
VILDTLELWFNGLGFGRRHQKSVSAKSKLGNIPIMKANEMHCFSNLFDQIYQTNLRNSASRWLSLTEHITMHGPLNVKFKLGNVRRS